MPLWIADKGLEMTSADNELIEEMTKCYNQDISIPSRSSVKRKMHKLLNSYKITTKDYRDDILKMVSISTDAWSFGINEGYFSFTLH